VLVVGSATGALQANCYLLAAGRDRRRVVVDPGQDGVERARKALREHGLTLDAVLATHGHPDHVESAGALTGDALFAGSVGHGDQRALAESLRDKLLTLPDDTVVLPGHGQPTTVGRERASNPFLSGAAVAT
jgi:glyoxylase-like metal-dependent hydrolase (beta-lactamase superfamily II)